jgi:hypothetical protein
MTLKKVYKNIRKVIIYEIVCNDTGERYIGSTIQKFNCRKNSHISKTNNTSSRKITNRENYNFNVLDSFNTRFELCKLLKEQYYIDNTKNINKLRAIDLYKNFKNKYNRNLYQKDKDRIKLRHKNYEKENREMINRRARNLIPIICPCGGKYKSYSKSKHLKTLRHKKYIDNI